MPCTQIRPFRQQQRRSRRSGTPVAAPSRRPQYCSATGGGSGEVTKSTAEVNEADGEEVFYEGRGAPAELIISLLLGATLLYLPLTAQSIGRRLWISYKFTNKRLIVSNTSPFFSKEVQILYSNICEVRAAPRAFGLWGDMVIFLKDGSRLELLGVENHNKLKGFVEGYIA